MTATNARRADAVRASIARVALDAYAHVLLRRRKGAARQAKYGGIILNLLLISALSERARTMTRPRRLRRHHVVRDYVYVEPECRFIRERIRWPNGRPRAGSLRLMKVSSLKGTTSAEKRFDRDQIWRRYDRCRSEY
jgi:hypothetical protein